MSAGREKMFVKLIDTKSNGIPLDTFPFNDPGMCQVMMAFIFHLTESLRFRYNCYLINLRDCDFGFSLIESLSIQLQLFK